jgi:regulator of CtrA degradation
MPSGRTETAFFSKTYDEALALLEETQACLSMLHPIGDEYGEPLDILVIRAEAFRLSTRLMQVAAWLLFRRAVYRGELDAATVAADERYRLGSRTVCRDRSRHHHPAIPEAMIDLLERSHDLYVRIERLDALERRVLVH